MALWFQLHRFSASTHPQEEGVGVIEPLAPAAARGAAHATLLCFVLVAPRSAHSFCSAYDFGPWPLLAGVASLQPRVLEVGQFSCGAGSHVRLGQRGQRLCMRNRPSLMAEHPSMKWSIQWP